MKYVNNIAELVGNTPMLKLNNMEIPAGFQVYAKLEIFNPGGSVKDRVGFQILKDAEAKNLINKDTVIIEPTAGNTGIGIALAACSQGYSVKIVVPEKYSLEKQIIIQALGAEVISTPLEEGMKGAIQRAYQLAEEIGNAYVPDQFVNPANPEAHYLTTGPEIYDQMDGQIDFFIAGAGTGGTYSGVVKYLKEKDPAIKGILVEPYGSTIGGGEEAYYHVEGIGSYFIPKTLDLTLVDEIEKVTDLESFRLANLLAQREGLTVGASSGAVMAAIYQQINKLKCKRNREVNLVTIFPDRSDRYFSKNIYNFKPLMVSDELINI